METENDVRLAECRPNLRQHMRGTRFDVYRCAVCGKLWSIARPRRSAS